MHSLKIINGVHYAGHAAYTGKTRNAYRIFVEIHWENKGDGSIILRRKMNWKDVWIDQT
jgi:hypothetical protein